MLILYFKKIINSNINKYNKKKLLKKKQNYK